MPSLDPTIRSALDKAVVEARGKAEDAARAALDVLAVNHPRPFATLTEEQRELRIALRAKCRQLGSGIQTDGFPMLVEEVAYVQWHRMLFARFLAGNNLLMHPNGVAVTLEECEELAAEEGDQDRWVTAARYAGKMLPGIFSPDDPSTQVKFAPEGRAALEAVLNTIPGPVFTSDDGLGWVYQFWQSKRKKEVSSSGSKIERLDLAAYSQLFTEDYMVRFLLENSLGAWWAARHPDSPLVKEFKYLRFCDDGTPAAGTFPGWPQQAAEVTVIDPCCGSGHFLVVAFEMLRRMRMEEEGLDGTEAAEAVLRDNLFGLEIDPRCVQIAAFAVAFSAWKVGGYRELSLPNIACSGNPVFGQLEAWTELAGGDVNMERTLKRLHELFMNAPDLGSLIDPMNVPDPDQLFTPDLEKVVPLLHDALAEEKEDPVAAVFGSTALGVAHAAKLLARQYTLVATNVPFLTRQKQTDNLRTFVDIRFPKARANLATAFMHRCRELSANEGTYAVVIPQNWLYQPAYKRLREQFLREQEWLAITRLGSGAFDSISGEVVNVVLSVYANQLPGQSHDFFSIDVDEVQGVEHKAKGIAESKIRYFNQAQQLSNPDCRVITESTSTRSLLRAYAFSRTGTRTADNPRFVRFFWKLDGGDRRWETFQSTVAETSEYGGREKLLLWESGRGDLAEYAKLGLASIQGQDAWGKKGVVVRLTGSLSATLYLGDKFDMNCGVIWPRDKKHLGAIWAYCSSPDFHRDVRNIDRQLKLTTATLLKVPFDLEYWSKAALDNGPIPEPIIQDPSQALFTGDPTNSTVPLQVAVARLLGYQWPQQQQDRLSSLAVSDGMLPLAAVAGEDPAPERLRRVLRATYGGNWSVDKQTWLLHQERFETKGLVLWLRDGFFAQHCKLFHQRPFIWHIWDGRKDGFAALVNYHRLDGGNLDKLIYTYLGDWIRTQRAAEEDGTPGANARLVAALELQRKLEAIRDGVPPYDIYVRWKSLREQPIGWNPDLNDGVRLNIRPFVTAGVLRSRVNVHWKKDRGSNPDGSERVNDLHYSSAQKRAAAKT
ncbi:MAG: N-6 DNA methylase [Caldilineaceae bacterium SB0665_bin_25]|nr:N-6 DNA methylase [Caldilineaceae bacterium SB0665_bin_25]